MRNDHYKNIRHLGMGFVLLALPLMSAQIAWGQGVGPPLGGTTTTHIGTGIGWDIPDGSLPPQPVIRDPSGQPWFKDLLDVSGGPVVAMPGDTFSIRERLVIDGNLDWADWHEDILTPDWEWDLVTFPTSFWANGAPAPGLVISSMPSTGTQGGSIWFDFDSLAPGTLIDISKTLVYNGDPGVVFNGVVQIAQYPTPEPASAVLMALGGLVFLRRRRT